MTNLEQIQSLVLDDAFFTILRQLLPAIDYQINHSALDLTLPLYDQVVLTGAVKPTLAEMNTQFGIYKQNLIDSENARLAEEARVKDIKDRLIAMPYVREAHLSLHPGMPNAYLWVKENILQADAALAEANLVVLENEHVTQAAISSAAIRRIDMKKKGERAKAACQSVMEYINGYGQSLTPTQEAQLITDHGSLLQLVEMNKAWSLKDAITAITPDTIITNEVKQDLLDELSEHGI